MHSVVQPNAWVALKLPSGQLRVLQVAPNTTISLGKYGSFPSNLIIHRPFNLTYELQDKLPSETFNRLRIVPAPELYSEILGSGAGNSSLDSDTPPLDDDGAEAAVPEGVEYTLVDQDSGAVVAKTDQAVLDVSARQTLSHQEIEELKKDSTDAGKDIIAKLLLSHTALDQKTDYSLAKYKLLKTKKYIRRFTVLPMDIPLMDYWLLEEKDAAKILDMREEMIGLLGCWANVHFGGEDKSNDFFTHVEVPAQDEGQEDQLPLKNQENAVSQDASYVPGRWLIVDDTGGLLVAAMAERMGVLYPTEDADEESDQNGPPVETDPATTAETAAKEEPAAKAEQGGPEASDLEQLPNAPASTNLDNDQNAKPQRKHHRGNDTDVPYVQSNTLTLIHANSQPNLSFLRYYDFDNTNPNQPLSHPLSRHLMTLSWLQLLEPEHDTTYSNIPPTATPEELRSWKANKRGTYHRKRRRWAKVRHVVDTTRKGGFAGLVVASTMDPISIMRHAAPLLAGGAAIAIYSQSVEPLSALVDCYSVARRTAWIASPPKEAEGKSAEELEYWPGTEDFPLNPSLLLGTSVQTSRVRKWQVLPGRTHPLMTSKGGAEGYVFTAWKVKPVEGKIEARGKRTKKRKTEAEE